VRAAHSGNNEVNTYAMGVSMMGNYDLVVPSPALKASMVDLISWRMGQSGLKAKGTWKVKEKGLTLNRIAGHRNVVSTACPGKYGYAWLSEKGGLRDRVEDTLAGTSTPAKPAPAAPTGVKVTPSTSGATVSWSAVDGAKTYGVCLVTSGTSTTCYRSLSGVTKTSASFADLKPTSGKDYYVKVRAGNESGAGAWSALSGFDLTPATPAKPAAVTGLTVTPTSSSAKIAWTAPAGAKTYGLCLQTSAASTSCYRSLSGLTTASTSITGLKPTANTDYFVKVRAGNGAGAGPWSALKAFNLTSSSSSKTATATAARSASEDSVKVSGSTISLAGHGFGHGIGMSQYGAQGAARDGVKYDKILSTYYQGTKLGTKTGTMRVLLSKDTTASVTVNGRSGLAFRKVGGSATSLPTSVGGKSVKQWRISPGTKDAKRSALQYKTGSWATYKSTTWTGDAQFEATAIRLVLPDSTTAVYRGALRSSVPKSGSTDRNTVNVLSIEDYVRGVVAAEMPSSWSAEALKAQAVAARTYGVRGLVPSRYYDMCDTTSCQVYRGQSGETTATDSAVAATKGKILTYKGSPAFTQYSSSSGGWTAPGSQPYLTAVEDPYDDWSGNGNHNWHATVKVATLQKAYPKLGTITSLTVKDRVGGGAWGGRVSSVTLKGSKASSTISGATMRSVLGLRSAWFAFS
jgi:SpoIID/LytB domain protein